MAASRPNKLVFLRWAFDVDRLPSSPKTQSPVGREQPIGRRLVGLHLVLPLANLERLGAIIFDSLAKPGVIQSLFGRDPLGGVVDEDFLEKIQELDVEVSVGRNDFLSHVRTCNQYGDWMTYLKLLHGLDVFLRLLGGVRVGVVELLALEVSKSC